MDAFASLPKIKTNLQVLEDVLHITNKDLNLISNRVVSNKLAEEQANALIDEVTGIINTSTKIVVTLQARLLEAAALHRATNSVSGASSPMTERSLSGAGFFPHTFQTEIAKQIGHLKVESEKVKSPAAKNINYFGYRKIQIPQFTGNIHKFTKWRNQVEDFITETATRLTERQAVHLLDRLTPKEIDVSRCQTLKDTWTS